VCCVAVCCSVLPCVAVCCSVLQCIALCGEAFINCRRLSRECDEEVVCVLVAVCCSVLPCVAVCCSR